MRRAALGWAALGVYVVACDAYLIRGGHPSLSMCFRGAPRAATTAAAALVLAHLYGLIPERVDPFCRIASALTPR